VKRVPVGTYRAQRRGGRGLQGMGTKEEDWVEHLFVASTHDYLMVFTRSGRCHWIKVWEIPEGGRAAKGKPIVNLLNIAPDESIAALVPVREFRDDRFLFFCTRQGVVKKTALSAYGNIRSVGLNAINVREGDELIDVQITDGNSQVILATREGLAIRFREANVRPMGRTTEGVRGIGLVEEDVVVGMVVVRPASTLLVVTERGMGKRSEVEEYRLQQRGGKGVINLRVTEKTGRVVSIKAVSEQEQLMVMTRNGVVNRQPIAEIRVIGRATQGVRLVNLDEGDLVMDVARVVVEENGDALARAEAAAEEASANGGAAPPAGLEDDDLDDDRLEEAPDDGAEE
jgi:DNA gyrase subunit A